MEFFKILDRVHKAGFAHCGDICIFSLIFSHDGTDSYLIDYDLARINKVGHYAC